MNQNFENLKGELLESLSKLDVMEPLDAGEELKPEMNLIDDLNHDSLDVIELIIEMEKKFSISIPDVEAEKIKTLGDLADVVSGLLSKK